MKNLLALLWPPYELHVTERAIRAQSSDGDPWTRALEASSAVVAALDERDFAEAELLAVSVLDAELKRKDVLESKAATFIVAPATATAITAVVASLSTDLQLSDTATMIVTAAYALTLVHLLVASSYAIAVRRTEGFVVLSTSNAHRLLKETPSQRIATRLAYAATNEPALARKANRLSVAEDLFLRGLASLAFASLVGLIGHLARI